MKKYYFEVKYTLQGSANGHFYTDRRVLATGVLEAKNKIKARHNGKAKIISCVKVAEYKEENSSTNYSSLGSIFGMAAVGIAGAFLGSKIAKNKKDKD
ncbi:hypothetical protein [Campylobacter sp. 19-13652]|uniref:hypothetical protein n=1 Tax=Campylobacter sp. 19-13652 TaxID=2840180 RepID=UPI001C7784D2|nr:hypothetical protein [Campylobacter sp. 19-13652]BCX78976.1 hypothetical protein LBC_04380 [Campylobacter sp. 19-13652]